MLEPGLESRDPRSQGEVDRRRTVSRTLAQRSRSPEATADWREEETQSRETRDERPERTRGRETRTSGGVEPEDLGCGLWTLETLHGPQSTELRRSEEEIFKTQKLKKAKTLKKPVHSPVHGPAGPGPETETGRNQDRRPDRLSPVRSGPVQGRSSVQGRSRPINEQPY